MSRHNSIARPALLVFTIALFAATNGTAGIPVIEGDYFLAYTGPETLTLMVLPDGTGETFDQAFLPHGGRADATVTLILWDAQGIRIANFPREDLWLASRDNGLVPCNGGTIADANTDAAGTTTWATPLFAGGHSEALAEVVINGAYLDTATGLELSFNSPDINGDLTVNLTDVQIFSGDFFSSYLFRSDFYRDGLLNLSDIPPLAAAVGSGCP